MVIDSNNYDHVCRGAYEATKAEGVILIVIGGECGTGFSVYSPSRLNVNIPSMLRKVASQLEVDNRNDNEHSR